MLLLPAALLRHARKSNRGFRNATNSALLEMPGNLTGALEINPKVGHMELLLNKIVSSEIKR